MKFCTCLPKKKEGGGETSSTFAFMNRGIFIHIASTHARRKHPIFVYLAVIKHSHDTSASFSLLENKWSSPYVSPCYRSSQCHLELWWAKWLFNSPHFYIWIIQGQYWASRSIAEKHQCLKVNLDMCSASQIYFTSVLHKSGAMVGFGPRCSNEPKVLDGKVSQLYKTAIV